MSDSDGAEGRPWQVRPHQAGDEQAATALWQRVFGRDLSVAHYRWKLLESPWQGDVPSVWYAEGDSGKLAGQYPGTVLRLQLGDEVVRVIHNCDVMTSPDFRRQGVLSAVGRAATDAWAAHGLAFVIGLPHSGWGSRSAYLGWETLFHARWWQRRLRVAPALTQRGLPAPIAAWLDAAWQRGAAWRSSRPTRQGAAITVSEVAVADERFDQLWERVRSEYEAIVVRDAAWLNYRFLAAPDIAYTLLLAAQGAEARGYAVLRQRDDAGVSDAFIVDIFAAPRDEATWSALFDAALQWADAKGAATIRTLAPEQGLLEGKLRAAAFQLGAGRYDVSAVALQGDGFPSPMQSAQRWFTTAGDYDVL